MTKIVGIAGRKGAGKDTAANVLVEERGYVNVKFADGIKKAAAIFFESCGVDPDTIERLINGDLKETPLDFLEGQSSINGFDGSWAIHADSIGNILGLTTDEVDGMSVPPFEGNTSREFQQFFGTEIGRNLVGDTVWTDQALAQAAQYEKVVISDVRFPNEIDAIRDAGGFLMRVERDTGSTEFSNHPSEQFIDTLDVHLVIDNNHTLNDLYWSVLIGANELPGYPEGYEATGFFKAQAEGGIAA